MKLAKRQIEVVVVVVVVQCTTNLAPILRADSALHSKRYPLLFAVAVVEK